MQKHFDEWNKSKKIIHENGENKLYHTRELWWCSLGVNVGSEQDGSGEKYDTWFAEKAGIDLSTEDGRRRYREVEGKMNASHLPLIHQHIFLFCNIAFRMEIR